MRCELQKSKHFRFCKVIAGDKIALFGLFREDFIVIIDLPHVPIFYIYHLSYTITSMLFTRANFTFDWQSTLWHLIMQADSARHK